MDRITADGRKIEQLISLGAGSLSHRYKARIEGRDYFLKTFQNSDACT